MFGNAGKNQALQPRMRMVYGSTFDGAPYQIALEDTAVGLGSSARIRKGHIVGAEMLTVAVKVFGELLDNVKQQLLVRELRFAREVSMCHNLILAFLGTATVGEQTAIVSLYMRNGNLLEYIKSHAGCNKKALILQVAEAVEFLHVTAHVVHGDLKCENVLVSDYGDALLADFGLSSFVEKSESLCTTMTAIRAMHTLQFAAPELLGIIGEEQTSILKRTTKSDIYAFGMLVLEAISEQPPWGKKTNFSIITSVGARQYPPRPTREDTFVAISHSWWDMCRNCWSFEPHKRPQIGDVLRTLRSTDPMPRRELPIDEEMLSAVYMPNGQTILAASSTSIILFDTTSHHTRHLRKAPSHYNNPGLAVSPGGLQIAYTFGETIRVLDAASGALVTSLPHDHLVSCVTYSRDGRRIASGTSCGTVRMWDATTGKPFGRDLDGHTQTVSSVSFSPYDISLASACYDGTIRLWDSVKCVPLATLKLSDSPQYVYSVKFLAGGMHIAAEYDGGMLVIWDVPGRCALHTFAMELSGIIDVAFSSSGKYVAAGGEYGEIKIWDIQSGNQVGTSLVESDEDVLSIAFSPDEKSLLSVSRGGEVLVWDLFD